MFATLAAEMRAFDGTQPTLRQSPPMRWFSIKAHLDDNREGKKNEKQKGDERKGMRSPI